MAYTTDIKPRSPITEPKPVLPSIPTNKKPVVLVILDGWGTHPDERRMAKSGIGIPEYRALMQKTAGNAIAQAKKPNFNKLWNMFPHTTLDASERGVGLPKDQMGNSEVGHMNIGSGRIVETPGLVSINEAINDGSFYQNAALNEYIAQLKASGGVCHLSGLLSGGGVHAHQDHIAALGNYIIRQGVKVKVHAITDGRDTATQSALECIAKFRQDCQEAEIVTVGGRYYGMDRDKNWDRIQTAYNTMVNSAGARFTSAEEAVNASYANGKTDEFIVPCVTSQNYTRMEPEDGFLFANFRADRAEQLCMAFANKDFERFDRGNPPLALRATLGMCQYSAEIPDMPVMFSPPLIENTLGEVASNAGLQQVRIAETEKYAHVTHFFNGGKRDPFEGETRQLVPSPKVATYDLKPEMSAEGVTQAALEAINSDNPPDLVVINYANPDMVGHTGNLPKTIEAIEYVDQCLGQIVEAVERKKGVTIVTADHGNADSVVDAKGKPDTKHTKNRVPLMIICEELKNKVLQNFETISQNLEGVRQEKDRHGNDKPRYNGVLANIAPTILKFLGLDIPKEMTHPPLQEYIRERKQQLSIAV